MLSCMNDHCAQPLEPLLAFLSLTKVHVVSTLKVLLLFMNEVNKKQSHLSKIKKQEFTAVVKVVVKIQSETNNK